MYFYVSRMYIMLCAGAAIHIHHAVDRGADIYIEGEEKGKCCNKSAAFAANLAMFPQS